MKDHEADVGDEWVADEMMVDVGGEKMCQGGHDRGPRCMSR